MIGKFTGKGVKGKRKNKDSQYIVEIGEAMFIDAEKEGNCT